MGPYKVYFDDKVIYKVAVQCFHIMYSDVNILVLPVKL